MSSDEFDRKCKQLADAWKGIRFDGAELIFNYFKRPELDINFDWPDGMKYENLPPEAFTGKLEDVWSVGWKACIDGNKYANYLWLTEPIASHDIVEVLRKDYEFSRKEIESRTRRARRAES